MKKCFAFIIVLLISCSEYSDKTVLSPNPIQAPKSLISATAKAYLNAVVDTMQKYSINKHRITWYTFRSETIKYAGNAQTTSDTYLAIRFAIKMLADSHSIFELPMKNIVNESVLNQRYEKVILQKASTWWLGCRINNRIGFVRVPDFQGSAEAANNLITEMQTTIKQVDTSTIKAWIVDLRKNMGGNMWPMLTGIGPVLGNGLAGKFVDADSVVTNWYYTDGISSVDGHYIHCFTNYYILKNPNPFVAVLTDNYTGSSGEAIVVSFRGRQKTRSFGINTMGRSTANKAFILSDGAKLFLTVATMADRNGVLYGKKIVPDENIKGIFKTNPLDNDEVVNAAINWIENVSKK